MTSHDTVFITGGNSGIGLGLAKAYHARGAKVIIGGRNQEALEHAARYYAGMETCVVDVSRADSIQACAKEMAERFPQLAMLINNAGVQKMQDFSGHTTPDAMAVKEEIDTNFTGLVQMTAAFLPLLKQQPKACIVNVSSGLAFVPRTSIPVYSATKAAVHSFTISLREQFRDSTVRIVELMPPLVETNLHRDQPANPHKAMALDVFVQKSIHALDSEKDELPIGLAKVLKVASRIAPRFFLKIVNK